MKLTRMRVCGFRCMGPEPVELTLENLTFLLGPNGTGKTTFLHAISRMFGADSKLRRVVLDDFHVPLGEAPRIGTAREFWIEADFSFPELLDPDGDKPAVALNFTHMHIEDDNEIPTVRFRLEAELDENGDITDELNYVLTVNEHGQPDRKAKVDRFDRAAIQVHYLPARRDPANHVSYSANSLLGKLLRAVDWQVERTNIADLSRLISVELVENTAISGIAEQLTEQWQHLHTGPYLAEPNLSFSHSEIESILRYVTLQFNPAHGQPAVDSSTLSDGQQSLLYISLVLAAQSISRRALADKKNSPFDLRKLRPPVYTLLAVEEPENSLSPHYLGRIFTALHRMTEGDDAQAIIATHSPSIIRRVDPEQIRYLRLNSQRQTTVATVQMPPPAENSHKFVREALHAYPELYFARLLVLGEGDSEEIVLPRFLRASGLDVDTASISVVPLGGRHVNHFWRLLHGLGIPHVTLLDLDLGRHQGGWGRIRYAAKELVKYSEPGSIKFDREDIEKLNATDLELRNSDIGAEWLRKMEANNVFFSTPLDLDFSMLTAFPEAYELSSEEIGNPKDQSTINAVLGKKGRADAYNTNEKDLFLAYHRRFNLGSKPTHHISAMAEMNDESLLSAMPNSIQRLTSVVISKLSELPE